MLLFALVVAKVAFNDNDSHTDDLKPKKPDLASQDVWDKFYQEENNSFDPNEKWPEFLRLADKRLNAVQTGSLLHKQSMGSAWFALCFWGPPWLVFMCVIVSNGRNDEVDVVGRSFRMVGQVCLILSILLQVVRRIHSGHTVQEPGLNGTEEGFLV